MPEHPDFDPDAYYGDPPPTSEAWVAPGEAQPPAPTQPLAPPPTAPYAAQPPAPPDVPPVPYGSAGGDPTQAYYAATPPPPPPLPPYGQGPGAAFPGTLPSGMGYGYAATPYPTAAVTNGKAIGALVTGIMALVLSACCWGGLLGLVAIPLGVVARSEVKHSFGYQQGEGIALAGIITGAIGLALTVVFVIASFGLSTISTP
ncbi:MAG: DUF4190 domain-containing protein [Nocardioidaceae bacterium]